MVARACRRPDVHLVDARPHVGGRSLLPLPRPLFLSLAESGPGGPRFRAHVPRRRQAALARDSNQTTAPRDSNRDGVARCRRLMLLIASQIFRTPTSGSPSPVIKPYWRRMTTLVIRASRISRGLPVPTAPTSSKWPHTLVTVSQPAAVLRSADYRIAPCRRVS